MKKIFNKSKQDKDNRLINKINQFKQNKNNPLIKFKQLKQSKNNNRVIRTLITGFISGFMIMFFGGLGRFTGSTFGMGILFEPSNNWYSILMITIGGTIMLGTAIWFGIVKYFRTNTYPTVRETQAMKLAFLGLAFVPIFIYTWMSISTVFFLNQVLDYAILKGNTNIYFNIFASIGLSIMAIVIGLSLYWGLYRPQNIESRQYAWIRNTFVALSTLSFMTYMTAMAGIGAFGVDFYSIIKPYDYVTEGIKAPNKTYLRLAWSTGYPFSKSELVTLFTELGIRDLNVSMWGRAFANKVHADWHLVPPASGLLKEKMWFFGANNSWQAGLVFGVITLNTIAPLALLGMVWKKGKIKIHNGKETVFNTLIVLASFLTVVYMIDQYIILYATSHWNPSIHNRPLDLVGANYKGTVYHWFMMALLLVVPGTIGQTPILKHQHKQKEIKKQDN